MTRPEQLVAYECDGLTAFRARPLAVAVPETAEEVIKLVRYCHAERFRSLLAEVERACPGDRSRSKAAS